VVSAYRLVLDAIADSKEGDEEKIRRSIEQGKEILCSDFARSKTTFLFTTANLEWLNPDQDGGTGISLGLIQKVQGTGDKRRGFVSGGMDIAVGDSIRLHRSDDSERVSHKLQYVERTTEDGGYWLSIPDGFGKGDRAYLIQTRAMSKRYKPLIGNVHGGRQPGHEKAPIPQITAKHTNKSAFPDGLYVAVSSVNDLYIVQSSRPVQVMLSLTRKNANQILGKGKNNMPLPFKPAEIILVLDAFFSQTDSQNIGNIINELVDMGYRKYMVNNLGQFSLFRALRQEVQLIAGPWLYTFNRWALSFVASLGLDAFVSPLENNRQNLERTLDMANRPSLRSMFFIPVFGWPPLFTIRSDHLGSLYNFKTFSDNRDEHFSLACDMEGSRVFPQKPFSITDKIPFLKEAGFRRFIIDLCGPPLKKNNYKDLMRAVNNGTPLPCINRFNWKNGFFSNES
jgi:putative protease